MKVNVIGLGYIGLPTALMMAVNGIEVVGTDYNSNLVDTLNQGKVTFEEKGLIEAFEEARKKGIIFTTEYQISDVYIIAVPTPYDKFSKKVDACYVENAVKKVLYSIELAFVSQPNIFLYSPSTVAIIFGA